MQSSSYVERIVKKSKFDDDKTFLKINSKKNKKNRTSNKRNNFYQKSTDL